MAQQVIVTVTDDIDGKEAAGSTTFALDGVTYEIDLSEANRAKLEKALTPFITHGRRVKAIRGQAGRVRTQGGSVPGEAAAIRVWAAGAGVQVPAKGRIPQAVREQYEAAQGA